MNLNQANGGRRSSACVHRCTERECSRTFSHMIVDGMCELPRFIPCERDAQTLRHRPFAGLEVREGVR